MLILIAEKEFSKQAKKILSQAGKVVDFRNFRQFLKDLPKAEVIVTGLEIKLQKPVLDRAPRLKLIGTRTTQLRYIDLKECARRGIKVISIKGESAVLKKITSTAEEALGLILALVRKMPWAFEAVKREKWDRKRFAGHQLKNKTLGLIGFGRLGRMLSGYCRALGMKILAFDPYVSKAEMAKAGARKVDLSALLKKSDVVSLHAVYNDKTEGMLKEGHFKMMKPSAFFINTARGEITDEKALLKALRNKWIAGAALDTLANEGPRGNHLKKNPLIEYAKTHENLIILPHLGGSTFEANELTQMYISKLVIREIKI